MIFNNYLLNTLSSTLSGIVQSTLLLQLCTMQHNFWTINLTSRWSCTRPSSRSRRSRRRNMLKSNSVVEQLGSGSGLRESTTEFELSIVLAHFRSRYRRHYHLPRRFLRHFRWSPGCGNWTQNRCVHRRRCNPAVARILKYIDVSWSFIPRQRSFHPNYPISSLAKGTLDRDTQRVFSLIIHNYR